MKFFKKIAAQGEIGFIRLPDNTKIPSNAIKVENIDNKVIVGHSETGHNHVMNGDCATLYRLPDSLLECLLVVTNEDQLTHLKEFDTHETINFEPGVYKVKYLREYVPEGFRKVQD